MSWFTKAGLNTIVLLRALWCQLWGACSRGSLHYAVLHSLHFPPIWRWCSTLPRKIHCTLTNRFSLNNPLTQKSELCSRPLSDGCQSKLYFAILVFEWREREQRGAKSISGWCIAENLGRQLNTDWKFTECCSTHLRFIWKQAPTVSGTNMSVGGQPGETSSWTVPTPMLHVLSSGLRTSKSKGKKNTFNITVLEIWRTDLFLCHKFRGKRSFHQ